MASKKTKSKPKSKKPSKRKKGEHPLNQRSRPEPLPELEGVTPGVREI